MAFVREEDREMRTHRLRVTAITDLYRYKMENFLLRATLLVTAYSGQRFRQPKYGQALPVRGTGGEPRKQTMDNPATLLIAELDAVAVPVPLAMGEILFQAGDPGEGAYVIRAGRVALTRSDNGKVYPMGTQGPKSILGLPAVLNGTYSLSARAVEDSTFGFIPSSSVVGLLDYFPRLLSEALKMLAQELARVRPMIARTGD